nr:hypothetical protein [Dyella sp. ASV24]
MQIGSELTSSTRTATLGCFVHKPGERGLYAIVSQHAFKQGDVVLHDRTAIGSVVDMTDAELDASLVKLNSTAASGIDKNSFKIHRGAECIKLQSVFDPSPIRAAKDQPATSPDRRRIEALHYMVWHEGKTSGQLAATNVDSFSYNSQFGVIAAKDIMNGRYAFEERPTRPGDSGGPVYLDNGQLVGILGGGISKPLPMVKIGQSLAIDTGSLGAFYRLAFDIFEKLGVQLATWQNKIEWREMGSLSSSSRSGSSSSSSSGFDHEDFGNYKPNDNDWVTAGQ